MKIFKAVILLIAGISFIGCSILNTPQNTSKQEASSRAVSSTYKVVGYMPSWAGNVADIQYDKLTHINYSFALPNADGTIQPIENPGKLTNLVTLGHQNNVDILIAVGGWNGGNDSAFETLAKNANLRTNFVNNIMSFVNTYNLDGVDIDWEYPDPGASGDAYTLLMSELATSLHGAGKILTAAVVGEGYTAGGVQDEVFTFIDFINIMAYDGGNGADHSPYSYAENTLAYWLGRGLPKEKAILGLPFYSRPGWLAYNTIVANNSNAPDVDFIDGQYYNGIATIKAKTELAMSIGGGVMMWELSQDTWDETSLLSAIDEVIGGSVVIDTEKPSTPLNLAGIAGEATATFSWSESTDNIAVTGYKIYVNGLNPISVSNVTTITLSDLEAGVFNFTITAVDRAGNESLTSNQIELEILVKICSHDTWVEGEIYTAGDIVSHNTKHWISGWWTTAEPGTTGEWGAWTEYNDCGIIVEEPVDTAPVVSILSDATTYINGDVITLTATATDDSLVKSVEFFSGTTSLFLDTGAPFTTTLTATTGNLLIKAVAIDDADQVTTSNILNITVSDVVGNPETGDAWASNVLYKVGDIVTYDGETWINNREHTSNVAWYPGAPGLWFWDLQ